MRNSHLSKFTRLQSALNASIENFEISPCSYISVGRNTDDEWEEDDEGNVIKLNIIFFRGTERLRQEIPASVELELEKFGVVEFVCDGDSTDGPLKEWEVNL